MHRVLKWLLSALAALLLLVALVVALGYRNALTEPIVVQQRLPLAGLQQPLRVVLVSDIHYGWPDMRTRRLNSIVTRINAQHPDLVLLAGDYMGGKWLDWPRSWLEEALPPLAALHAPLGVFAAEGNHDNRPWTRRVIARQIAPKLLVGEVVDTGPVVVAAFPSSAYVSPGALQTAMVGKLPRNKPALLLMHEPEQLRYIKVKPRPGILALAGHTHGGQVVLPLVGALSERFHGRFDCRRGFCHINGWPVVVTSGLGTSTLPIRFGVPPEILVLTLVPGGPLPAAGNRETPSAHQAAGRKSGTER